MFLSNPNAHHHGEIHYWVQLTQTKHVKKILLTSRAFALPILIKSPLQRKPMKPAWTLTDDMVGLYLLQRKLVVCNHKSPLHFVAEIIRTKPFVPKIKDVKVAASSWWLQAGPVFLPFTTERSCAFTASSPNTVPKACWHGHVNFPDSCPPVPFLGSCSSYGLWVHPGPQARKVLQSQGFTGSPYSEIIFRAQIP